MKTMQCSVCGKTSGALTARAFSPSGGYEFDPWYCDDCAEAEKETEPWKRGYTQGQLRFSKVRAIPYGVLWACVLYFLVGFAVGLCWK